LGSSVTLAGNGQKRWEFQGFGANDVPKAEVHLGNVGVEAARRGQQPAIRREGDRIDAALVSRS
jgi:hypothetical protein